MNALHTGGSKERTVPLFLEVVTLIGIPAPIGFESPASWLTRAALSQGVSPRKLLEHFGFDRKVDPDLFLLEKVAQKLLIECQLPFETFDFAVHVFKNLRSIDPIGEIFLLGKNQLAEYRYCPVCLHLSRTKHFMVHWRFRAWRHCPLHRCMMEENCLSCGALVQLPTDMLSAGPEKKGIAYMDLCRVCGQKLSSHWEKVFGTVDQSSVSEWKWSQLLNGRATLAAVYHGELGYMNGPEGMHGLRDLLKLDRRGLIPNRYFEGMK